MIYSIEEEANFNKVDKMFESLSKPTGKQVGNVEFVKKSNKATYGIIKEHNQYVIKIASKDSKGLFAENFEYIGGYGNRKVFQRKTLQEAIRYTYLLINEDKYVVDVPVVQQPAPAPQAPESFPPAIDPEPTQDNPAFSGAENIQLDSDATDGQKEIQSMTGKLAQDLRQEIQDGNEELTVGVFKSILAAAKQLSPEKKETVMAKAEEVLSPDESQEQVDNSQQMSDNNQPAPVQESEDNPFDKTEFFDIETPYHSNDFQLFKLVWNAGNFIKSRQQRSIRFNNKHAFKFNYDEIPHLLHILRNQRTDEADMWAQDIEDNIGESKKQESLTEFTITKKQLMEQINNRGSSYYTITKKQLMEQLNRK